MPELPEVETIVRDLRPCLLGRRFMGLTLHVPKVVRHLPVKEFRYRLLNQKITELKRRGKYLVFHLSSGDRLLIHLKMTGALLLKPSSAPREPHTRALFFLDNGQELRFCDLRKFGAFWLGTAKEAEAELSGLGPEPLEAGFTAKVLAQCLAQRAAPIKALLLDQGLVAGLGNIYANEALFQAGIHPLRPGRELTSTEVLRLHRAIRQVLKEGIGHRGTTIASYRDAHGEAGRHQSFLSVHHREGEPCLNCDTPLERLTVRQRSSYFCPQCQK